MRDLPQQCCRNIPDLIMPNGRKPPNGQERECSMEVAFPHTQDDGSLRRSQPYVKQRPSRNSPFDNAKPYLRNGRQVSHAEAPFSLASSTDRTRCLGAPSSKPAITALCDSRVVWRMEFLRLRRRCSSSPRCWSLFLIRFTKPDVMRTADKGWWHLQCPNHRADRAGPGRLAMSRWEATH